MAPAGTGGTNSEPVRPSRRRLPDERLAITHHFSIAGHEGYLTVGLYEDGSPGEIFITMAKQGSTISGPMDSFATVVRLLCSMECRSNSKLTIRAVMRRSKLSEGNQKKLQLIASE